MIIFYARLANVGCGDACGSRYIEDNENEFPKQGKITNAALVTPTTEHLFKWDVWLRL